VQEGLRIAKNIPQKTPESANEFEKFIHSNKSQFKTIIDTILVIKKITIRQSGVQKYQNFTKREKLTLMCLSLF
jgi:hypothetical protein